MDSETKPRNREISTGLLRQRRNVIISSVAVFVFTILGFQLEEIRILGNAAKVSNPHYVPILIFTLHGYFTWRYWQYYLEENHRPSISKILKTSTLEYEEAYLDIKSAKYLNELHSFRDVNYIYPRYETTGWGASHKTVKDVNTSFFSKNVFILAHIYSNDIGQIFNETDGIYTFKNPTLEESEWKFQNNSFTTNPGVYVGRWANCFRLAFIWFKAKALIKYILKQSYFTDYQLPLVMALLSILFSALLYIK